MFNTICLNQNTKEFYNSVNTNVYFNRGNVRVLMDEPEVGCDDFRKALDLGNYRPWNTLPNFVNNTLPRVSQIFYTPYFSQLK